MWMAKHTIQTLTERAIRDAKAETKPYILRERATTGFGVRVLPSGIKTFVLDYRVSNRRRLIAIARVGELDLKAARHAAQAMWSAIRDGDYPMAKRERQRTASTVVDGWLLYEAHCIKRVRDNDLAPRSLADYQAQARRCILPRIGWMRIADVRRQDIRAMLADEKPVQRNRVQALAAPCLHTSRNGACGPRVRIQLAASGR